MYTAEQVIQGLHNNHVIFHYRLFNRSFIFSLKKSHIFKIQDNFISIIMLAYNGEQGSNTDYMYLSDPQTRVYPIPMYTYANIIVIN